MPFRLDRVSDDAFLSSPVLTKFQDAGAKRQG